MKIWVDADACPREAKDLVFRAAIRLKIPATLVANSPMRIPRSPWITLDRAPSGFNEADDYIVERVSSGDLVVTADIPLAARIVDRGAVGIDPRGQVFTEDNVKARLATRNLLAELRESGLSGGGPLPYRSKDKSAFASTLDFQLTKLARLAPRTEQASAQPTSSHERELGNGDKG